AAVAAAAVFGVGTVMGIALIANGLHYPTDVVAGFCTALAIVLLLGLGLDSIGPRARQSTPTTASAAPAMKCAGHSAKGDSRSARCRSSVGKQHVGHAVDLR
ncbi:MAG: hypothetical protein ACRDTJ_22875, partial [Pseudonocardiaceae bacterium]